MPIALPSAKVSMTDVTFLSVFPSSKMASSSRSLVLSIFKRLQRTTQFVFQGDTKVIDAARMEINNEFRSKMDVVDPKEMVRLVGMAEESDKILR